MRDPAHIYTRRGTPFLMIFSRAAFFVLFVFSILTLEFSWFPNSTLEPVWLAYLIVIYVIAERLYDFFGREAIDLSFAFPIMLAIYILSLVGVLLGGQEQLPLLNRAEHLTTYILIGYIVWTFFTKYLPQDVWQEHPYYTALLVLSVTAGLGVLNEIIELALDILFGTNLLGSHLDTPLDLLMNTLGASLFLSVYLILGSTGSKKPPIV